MSDRPNAPPPPAPLTAQEVIAYLEYEMTTLLSRRKEIVEALEKTATAYPTIDNDDQLALAAENRRMAETLLRTADERRLASSKPYREAQKTTNDWFTRALAPLVNALEPIKLRMDDYGRRKLARERAAAEEAARKAKAEADRRTEEARKALEERKPAADVSDKIADAIHANTVADAAQSHADAKPAAMTRVRSDFGAVTSMRTIWRWRIIDEAAVPREFLMVNPDKVATALKDGGRDAQGRPQASIPGIEVYAEQRMGVR